MFLHRTFPLAAVLLLPLSARVARGEECSPANRVSTCVDADNLWHRPGAAQFTSVAGTSMAPAGQLSFSFLVAYQQRPVVFRLPSAEPGGTDAYAIDDQLNGSLLWALGLRKGVELTLATPITLYQNGVGVSPLVSQRSTEVVRSAIRDARVGVHGGWVRRAGGYLAPGPALSLRGELIVPTGDGRVFAGGKGLGFAPSLVFDYRAGPVVVALEAGARVRSQVEVAGTTIGTQLYEALGVSVDVLGERLAVTGEVFSLQGFGPQKVLTRDATGVRELGDRPAHLPTEWLLGLRSAPVLAGDLTMHLGGGGPLPVTDNDVTAPAFRLLGGVRYAPLGRDRDSDGILDRDDRCPTDPEDRDGFEDDDGCPDSDNDRDGAPDAMDRCRDAPEDKDGFEDEDGCPDPDDDGDGIPDGEDSCRNQPEDRDGFEDEEGCPDTDNDKDGILDKDDICPNGPEDFDEFKDEDGCPDPDNDADGILDKQDRCPFEAEDKDGFEDEDGCPEPDNDHDGILDKLDRCPNEAETINGIEDEDGCLEPNAKDLVSVDKGRVEVATPVRFAPGKAKITAEIERSLRMIAQKARGAPRFDRLVVEVYGDGPTPTAKQEALASERAEAVRALLLTTGLTADTLSVAVGDLSAKRSPRASHIDALLLQKRSPRTP
ncbi:MAG: OmpA family protein [Myxococcales bacterium]|nr:OmpA family protein [Polyangiaceae bacterium]MDW8250905.1 OmpA family protein [Myxococcales bacterium]